MRHLISTLIAVLAVLLFSTGLQAQQDTTPHVRDTTSHMRHRTKDTTTSNGSVTGKRVGNQDQSGVVNNKGKSTLGSKVKQTTPTEGQPVTAKGDTLRNAKTPRHADSTKTDSSRPHQ